MSPDPADRPPPASASGAGGDPVLEVRNLTVELLPRRRRRPRRRRGGEADGGGVTVVEEVDLTVRPGETLGLVGESGSGKSVTALSLLRLLSGDRFRIRPGARIRVRGEDVLSASGARLRRLRGGAVGVVFQDPGAALNPVLAVGRQVVEPLRAHRGLDGEAAREEAVALLRRVGFRDAGARFGAFPHELSGGEQQRVALAAALAGSPAVLLADEPTSALDVTLQAEILELLADLQEERGLGLVLVSHDLAVVAGAADRVAVLYAGRIVEEGPGERVLRDPAHPYTRALLGAVPRPGGSGRLRGVPGSVPAPGRRPGGCRFRPRCPHAWSRCGDEPPPLPAGRGEGWTARCWLVEEPGRARSTRPEPASAAGSAYRRRHRGPVAESPPPGDGGPAPLLEAREVHRVYRSRRGGTPRRGGVPPGDPGAGVAALRGVSLALRAGEAVGLAGESGSGKSTLLRLLLGLEAPTAGEVLFRGASLGELDAEGRRAFRRAVQIVFQSPAGSLNPRLRVGAAIREVLRVHPVVPAAEVEGRTLELLADVGLDADVADRLPGELSGGERQRASLARALAPEPELLLADEPVSSLDPPVQARILNLLTSLQEARGLGLLVVGHDLAVLGYLCDRIVVLRDGEVVEAGEVERVFRDPRHPYTRGLLEAVQTLPG